jgi:hypothetical protein
MACVWDMVCIEAVLLHSMCRTLALWHQNGRMQARAVVPAHPNLRSRKLSASFLRLGSFGCVRRNSLEGTGSLRAMKYTRIRCRLFNPTTCMIIELMLLPPAGLRAPTAHASSVSADVNFIAGAQVIFG